MNVKDIKGDWKEVVDILKQKYVNLTDDDFLVFKGREEEMLERLRYKLGKTKEEVLNMIVFIYLRNQQSYMSAK